MSDDEVVTDGQEDQTRRHCKRVGRFSGAILIVPAVVGFVGAFSDGLGFLLFIFLIPAATILLFAGSILSFVRGVRISRLHRGRGHRAAVVLISPALLLATLWVAWPVLGAGRHVGDLMRLTISRDHYEAIIAKAQITRRSVSYEEDSGITYSVDPGPPVRVAFNPAGILDNWSGIIF